MGSNSSVSRGPRTSVLPALSGALGGLPGSLLFACRLVPVRRVFTVPYGFGVELPILPCGPYARPLFGPLAVPPYFASFLVGVASPRL